MILAAELLIELVVIAALYGLFNTLLNFSQKPKYEMIYGILVILIGPANYFFFGFEIQGFFHSIIGLLIMIIGWKKWHKSRNRGKSSDDKKPLHTSDKLKSSHVEASGDRSVVISRNVNGGNIITGDQKVEK